MNEIFAHSELISICKWILATKDAHDLYKQFGFKEIEIPERLMEQNNKIL